jgi:hypothetical protein
MGQHKEEKNQMDRAHLAKQWVREEYNGRKK